LIPHQDFLFEGKGIWTDQDTFVLFFLNREETGVFYFYINAISDGYDEYMTPEKTFEAFCGDQSAGI